MIIQFFISTISLLRKKLYDLNVISKQSFDIPIVSVGNISMGGTGKTPMVAWLCKELMHSQMKPCIITRGYNRKNPDMIIINPNEINNYTVSELGDEPFELLNKLPGVSMVVYKDKVKAIKTAINVLDIDLIILDDGFQSLYINRDIDIVLLNNKNKNMLNREPYDSLKRADVIVFNDDIDLSKFKLFINQKLDGLKTLQLTMRKKAYINLDKKQNVRLLAVSGIANSNSFDTSLIDQKINVVKHLRYKDHHNYSQKDMNKICQYINKLECAGIITTSKDYYKLKKINQKNIKIYRLDIDFIPVNEDVFSSNKLIDKIKDKI